MFDLDQAIRERPFDAPFAGSALMKIQTIKDFARPQDLAALRSPFTAAPPK
jgi:hypothetical protein